MEVEADSLRFILPHPYQHRSSHDVVALTFISNLLKCLVRFDHFVSSLHKSQYKIDWMMTHLNCMNKHFSHVRGIKQLSFRFNYFKVSRQRKHVKSYSHFIRLRNFHYFNFYSLHYCIVFPHWVYYDCYCKCLPHYQISLQSCCFQSVENLFRTMGVVRHQHHKL